jgi:hypothetical protein
MANAQYEMLLEEALRLACVDNGEYHADGDSRMVQYLFNMYLEKAKKVLDKN